MARDRPYDLDRIEAWQNDQRPPAEQHGFDRTQHRILVIQRHGDQGSLSLIERFQLAQQVYVPDLPAMRQKNAFWPTRRTGRVWLETDVVRMRLPVLKPGRSSLERLVIIQSVARGFRIDNEVPYARKLSKQRPRAGSHFGIGDKDHSFGVGDDVIKCLIPHPNIKRDRNRTQTHRSQ